MSLNPFRNLPIYLAALVALFLGSGLASAQNIHPSEVGFVFSATAFPEGTEAGVGARFLHNYNPKFAFEYQGVFYPLDSTVNYYQNSFNFKLTHRMEAQHKINVFALLGPGFLIQDRADVAGKTRFSVNVGGGVEVVPDPRVSVRLDLTDYIYFAKGKSPGSFDLKLAVMYRW